MPKTQVPKVKFYQADLFEAAYIFLKRSNEITDNRKENWIKILDTAIFLRKWLDKHQSRNRNGIDTTACADV